MPSIPGAPNTSQPSQWGAIMTWTLLLACAAISVIANVAGARPAALPRFIAGAPPIIFLICVEVLLRAELPNLARFIWTRYVGLVIVALVTAYASYLHQVSLLLSIGEHPSIAMSLPLVLDGGMLLASVTLIGVAQLKRQNRDILVICGATFSDVSHVMSRVNELRHVADVATEEATPSDILVRHVAPKRRSPRATSATPKVRHVAKSDATPSSRDAVRQRVAQGETIGDILSDMSLDGDRTARKRFERWTEDLRKPAGELVVAQ